MGAYIFMMIVVFILVVLAGGYLYWYCKRVLREFGVKRRWVIRLVSGGLTAVAVLRGINMFSIGATIMLFIITGCVVTDLLQLFVCKCVKNTTAQHVWKIIRCRGLLAVLICVLLIVYGYWNMTTIVQKDYAITTTKELTNNTLVIAQMSDLHLGTTMDATKLKTQLDRIEQQQPDCLVLTGDIFDESTKKEQMELAAKEFGEINTKNGVYYVLGNHDSNQYVEDAEYTKEEMVKELEKNGITVLEDQAVLVADSYYIIGRVDASISYQNGSRMSVEELVSSLDQSKYMILLDHQPVELSEAKEAGIDLELSGHTHGGQIWPTGELSTLFGSNEMNYGIRTQGSYTEIVSSGIAGWGYPLRTGGHSEYVIVTVTR